MKSKEARRRRYLMVTIMMMMTMMRVSAKKKMGIYFCRNMKKKKNYIGNVIKVGTCRHHFSYNN